MFAQKPDTPHMISILLAVSSIGLFSCLFLVASLKGMWGRKCIPVLHSVRKMSITH